VLLLVFERDSAGEEVDNTADARDVVGVVVEEDDEVVVGVSVGVGVSGWALSGLVGRGELVVDATEVEIGRSSLDANDDADDDDEATAAIEVDSRLGLDDVVGDDVDAAMIRDTTALDDGVGGVVVVVVVMMVVVVALVLAIVVEIGLVYAIDPFWFDNADDEDADDDAEGVVVLEIEDGVAIDVVAISRSLSRDSCRFRSRISLSTRQ